MIKNIRKYCIILLLATEILSKENKTTLRIATYNVENLYDRYDDPYNYNDSRADKSTVPKPARELYALSKVIKKVNADVLAMQEVENRGFLAEFNNAYLDSLKYNHVILIEGNSSRTPRGRGIDLAVLTRVPVYSATTFQYFKFPLNKKEKSYTTFSRDFLYIKLKPEHFPEIHLFVLHPISRRGGAFAHYKRIAEAHGAAKVIMNELSGKKDPWIIVAGDFNDTPDSESVRIFQNIPGIPLKRIPAYDLKKKPYTFYGKGGAYPPDTIDHIIVSKPVEKALLKPTASIWNDKSAATASDHRPVYITLKSPE